MSSCLPLLLDHSQTVTRLDIALYKTKVTMPKSYFFQGLRAPFDKQVHQNNCKRKKFFNLFTSILKSKPYTRQIAKFDLLH